MRDHDEFLDDDDDWTLDERRRLASLPRERMPPDGLRERTIVALRERGLLRRRRRAGMAAMLLAASVIFIAGALVGYVAARRTATPDVQPTIATRQNVAQADTAITQAATRHVVWY